MTNLVSPALLPHIVDLAANRLIFQQAGLKQSSYFFKENVMKHLFVNTIKHEIPETTLLSIKSFNESIEVASNRAIISYNPTEVHFGILSIDKIIFDDLTGISEIKLVDKSLNKCVHIAFSFTSEFMYNLLPFLNGTLTYQSLSEELQKHCFLFGKDYNYDSIMQFLAGYLTSSPTMKEFSSILGVNPKNMEKLPLVDEFILNSIEEKINKYRSAKCALKSKSSFFTIPASDAVIDLSPHASSSYN